MQVELKPRITVVGVGGAGGNAVNNMIRAKLEGVEFVVANTDAQALTQSLVPAERRVQLGLHVTQGLGAGSKPDVGRSAAEESIEEITNHLKGSNMVFITGGMGGGTGTGSAPVIARAARESGILTVGVVTKPFHFEGSHRTRTAEKGIEELQQYVDTLIIIPNQNLFRIANERTTFADAFKMADDVLYSGVRGVTDLMIMPGLINLDFADIRAVMAEMGKAMMGTGEAQGERRALDAAEAAISNPLLDDVSMNGARGVLINITGGFDMTLYEVDEAANRIRDEVDPEANIIFGSTFDEKLNGTIRVSVVATGIGPVKGQTAMAPARQETTATATNMSSATSSTAPMFTTRDFSFPGSTGFVPPKSTSTTPVHADTDESPLMTHDAETQEDLMAPLLEENTEHIVSQVEELNTIDTGRSISETDSPTTDLLNDIVSDLNGTNIEEPLELTNSVQEEKILPLSSAESKAAMLKAAAPLEQIAVQQQPEKKRPSSLFERFTGVARGRSTGTTDSKTPISVVASTDKGSAEEDSDILEIPAFLRREG